MDGHIHTWKQYTNEENTKQSKIEMEATYIRRDIVIRGEDINTERTSTEGKCT